MARCVVPLVVAYATVALLFFLLLSLPPRRQHRPHRRLKLRTAAVVLTPGDHHRIPFDPIISEIEIIRDDREWERNRFVSIGGAPPAEPQPEWETFTDAEDYINDEDKFNVTDRIKILFPKIDVSPQDGFITHEELTEWNFKQAENEVLHRTRRDMELRDKDHDGCISFQEYEPPNWVRRAYDYNLTDEKVGWWKEEHFNASDMDGNGCLNLTEFNDFLHPADTDNPKLIEWLCREEIRERDKDDDGRFNYHEYLTSLFRLIRHYDEFSSSTHEAGSSSETQAKQLFAQLDLNKDGFLSANELKPIINNLHPSERFFAKQQADYVISQADTDKDGRLSLKEMIDNPYVFYSVIFSEENDYIYHDEFR